MPLTAKILATLTLLALLPTLASAQSEKITPLMLEVRIPQSHSSVLTPAPTSSTNSN